MGKNYPCPHGRLPMNGQDGWKHCPHCLGLNTKATDLASENLASRELAEGMSKPNTIEEILTKFAPPAEESYHLTGAEPYYAIKESDLPHLKNSLNELYLKKYLELLGKQRPYKDGNYSYWCGEKDLRQELREEATKRFRNV